MAFPTGPANGEQYQTTYGSRYQYSEADDKWVKVGFPVSGVTGPQGETGPLGLTGLAGDTGTFGLTGYQGITGQGGITGDQGATGPQGATGEAGFTGSQGETGPVGVTGSGATGVRGIEGGYTGTMNIIVEGGSSAISSGTKGNIRAPFDLTLQNWTVLAEETGTIYFNIYKGTYAAFPPSSKMHPGLTGPHIVNGIKNQDLDISDWDTTSMGKGEIMRVEVDGSQSITNASLSFDFNKS